MAVLSKEDFLNVLKERIGDSIEEADLKFLEDMTDTYNDLESSGANNEWKQKYEQSQEELKQQKIKYRDRFFSSGKERPENLDDNDSEPEDNKPKPEETKLEDSLVTDIAAAPEGAILVS